VDLCDKRPRWSIAYRHPGGHRTSNTLDRQMRGMSRYFDRGQHLHGSVAACRPHRRAWALLWNFTPWHPATIRENGGWRCPAERLNRHRYHDSWLQNLRISASLGWYRCPLPQNQWRLGKFKEELKAFWNGYGVKESLTPEVQAKYRAKVAEIQARPEVKKLTDEAEAVNKAIKPLLKPAGTGALGGGQDTPHGYVWLFLRRWGPS
jgi:hypothetical protein